VPKLFRFAVRERTGPQLFGVPSRATELAPSVEHVEVFGSHFASLHT